MRLKHAPFIFPIAISSEDFMSAVTSLSFAMHLKGCIWSWGFKIEEFEEELIVYTAWYKFNNNYDAILKIFSQRKTRDIVDLHLT